MKMNIVYTTMSLWITPAIHHLCLAGCVFLFFFPPLHALDPQEPIKHLRAFIFFLFIEKIHRSCVFIFGRWRAWVVSAGLSILASHSTRDVFFSKKQKRIVLCTMILQTEAVCCLQNESRFSNVVTERKDEKKAAKEINWSCKACAFRQCSFSFRALFRMKPQCCICVASHCKRRNWKKMCLRTSFAAAFNLSFQLRWKALSGTKHRN